MAAKNSNKEQAPEVGRNVTLITIIAIIIAAYFIQTYAAFFGFLATAGLIILVIFIIGKYFGGLIGLLITKKR